MLSLFRKFSWNPGSDGIICTFRINMSIEFSLPSFVEFVHLWKKNKNIAPGQNVGQSRKTMRKNQMLIICANCLV